MTFKKVPKIKRGKDGRYPKSLTQKINEAKTFDRKFMIATLGEHLLGPLNRKFNKNCAENLCMVSKKIDKGYVGSWLTGIGFFDVVFPFDTTRELTKEEIKYFNGGKYIQLASNPPQKLKVD